MFDELPCFTNTNNGNDGTLGLFNCNGGCLASVELLPEAPCDAASRRSRNGDAPARAGSP